MKAARYPGTAKGRGNGQRHPPAPALSWAPSAILPLAQIAEGRPRAQQCDNGQARGCLASREGFQRVSRIARMICAVEFAKFNAATNRSFCLLLSLPSHHRRAVRRQQMVLPTCRRPQFATSGPRTPARRRTATHQSPSSSAPSKLPRSSRRGAWHFNPTVVPMACGTPHQSGSRSTQYQTLWPPDWVTVQIDHRPIGIAVTLNAFPEHEQPISNAGQRW